MASEPVSVTVPCELVLTRVKDDWCDRAWRVDLVLGRETLATIKYNRFDRKPVKEWSLHMGRGVSKHSTLEDAFLYMTYRFGIRPEGFLSIETSIEPPPGDTSLPVGIRIPGQESAQTR